MYYEDYLFYLYLIQFSADPKTKSDFHAVINTDALLAFIDSN